MKQVIYEVCKERVEYYLTDEEFFKAVEAWSKGQSFYSIRLEALLSPYYKQAGTIRGNEGYMAILYIPSKELELKMIECPRKIFWKNGEFFNEDKRKYLAQKRERFIKVIPEDEFYSRKFYEIFQNNRNNGVFLSNFIEEKFYNLNISTMQIENCNLENLKITS